MSFTHALADYHRDFDIIGKYKRDMIEGVRRMTDATLEEATAYLEEVVSKADLDKFVAEFTVRDANGDRTIKKAKLLDYLKSVEDKGLIMSPTMTTYLPPGVKQSYVTKVIAEDQDRRSAVKKDAQDAKQRGDSTSATIGKGMQNAIKFLVNSWSGASKSASTPYYNPSMHPSLTSMCRISTALATATAEKMISGKRYYWRPERVIEDILNTIATVNRTQIERCLHEYNLITPSVDNVMEIIEASTSYYWEDVKSNDFIRKFVTKLKDWERAAVAYCGDFYDLLRLNPEVVGGVVTELVDIKLGDASTDSLKKLDGDMTALLSNLIGTKIKGKKLNDVIKESPEIKELAFKVADNIFSKFTGKYKRFVSTFLRPENLPIDTGRQFNSVRKAVALGDTDSTVFTTGPICELFYGVKGYGEDQEPVNDLMTYIINGSIAHALFSFTGQMNIPVDRRHLLEMKNEFKFPSVQLTPAGKTYHAYTKAEEGRVYANPEWELKGSRLHAGRTNRDLVNTIHEWMRKGKLDLNSGGKIDRGELIDIILTVEHDLKASLSRKDNVYFTVMKIKPFEEYSNPMSQEWGKHLFYDIMFSDTHGKTPEPIYTTYKVNLNFPSGVKAWYDTLPEKYQKRYLKWMETVGVDFKKAPTFVTIPTDNFKLHGLPSILKDVVDLRMLAGASLDSAYLNLASSGINLDYDKKKPGLLLSDIIDA